MTSPAHVPVPTDLDRTSPALAVVGFLMALAALLSANPKFGVQPMWPWEMLVNSERDLSARAVGLVWMVTSVWLLLLCFATQYRLRSSVALAFGLILLFELTGVYAGMQVQRFFLNELLSLSGLGIGLLLLRRDGAIRAGAYVCLASALALLVSWAVGFTDLGGLITSRMVVFGHDIRAFVTGGVFQGEASGGDVGYPWHTLLPQLVTFVVAGAALVVSLMGVAGRRVQLLATVLFGLLFAAMAAPLVVRIVRVLMSTDAQFSSIVQHVIAGLVDDGLVVWMLVCFAAADLSRRGPRDAAWEVRA